MRNIRDSFLLLIAALSLLGTGRALTTSATREIPHSKIPASLESLKHTEFLLWNCPVSDIVEVETQTEAVRLMEQQCTEAVAQAAAARPNVAEVLKKSVDNS